MNQMNRRRFTRKKRYLIIIDDKVVEVKKNKPGTLWDLFKHFINSKKVNEIFTRKDLLDSIYNVPMQSHETSVDIYRNNVTHLGFLEHVGRGKYKKLYNIPKQITTTQINNALTDRNTWKDWFITLHDKLGVDESVELPGI